MITDFSQRWPEIEPLLDRLFDVPAAGRADWLRRHCADVSLRRLVEQALGNAPCIEALERGVAQWLPALADGSDALPSVAGYRVLRFVGAGGMASVFEAERALPGGPQNVALKILRIDVHDPDERRRFLREQRILAQLQHVHIAQLLDAGFTPAGTPFLALEYIGGQDVVAHCENAGLGTRERLALFIDVCAAVEHAHRNLIVHRDLKPSNVLVRADGCVKLLDFGIAKLLGGDGEDTRTEAQRLTRSYAAPEQFAGETATTAIDIYALGVLLARLLCGLRLHGAIDAPAPARADSDVRLADDVALRRLLGADLHAIVRKATRFDPAGRYASAAALREDIERYLAGKPLQARADTFAYRAFTLMRRHAFALAGAAVIAAALTGAALVSLHEARLAQRAAREEHAQVLVAEGEAKRADAVKSFLEGLFDSAAPGTHSSETAEELLARGRERADRDFAAQPELRVEVLALVGDLERRSGHPDLAKAPLEQAAALAKAQFGAADRRTLHVEYLLAKEADELGHVREAVARLRGAIDAFDAATPGGSPEEVPALAWLAGLEERSGASAQAIGAGEKALALARRVLPDDSASLEEAVMNFGWILMDAGDAERATPLLREALARTRARLGARHADVADAMTILSSALVRLGRYGEAEQTLRAALDIDASAYAHPHMHVAWHLNDLANVLVLEDKLDEAAAFYRKSIDVDQALAPTSAHNHAVSLANLARLRLRQGDYAAAEAGLRDAIERNRSLLGADYADNGRSHDLTSLAEVLIARGRLDEAGTLLDDALAEARRRAHGAHPDVALALDVQAGLLAARGDCAGAAPIATEAVATYSLLADARSDKSVRARLRFGEILASLGRGDAAKSQFEDALTTAKATDPPRAVLVARAADDLARIAAVHGDRATADRLHSEASAALAALPTQAGGERDVATRLAAEAPSCAAASRF